MKILLTGASSFTGYWFASELAQSGHQVTATFTGENAASYTGLRAQRVASVLEQCRGAFHCRFGDESFLSLVKDGDYDLLCHHGAEVTNYKSADFDIPAAVQANCYRLNDILITFKKSGGRALLLTGSVFEGGEGAGSDGLPHFSPYGVSKALTSQLVAFACEQAQLAFAKFVIPNPFGPYEEERFTAYLAKCWHEGKPATVRTPEYVRDNIHVSLLAMTYSNAAEQAVKLSSSATPQRYNPSGYIESQAAFAQRFAQQLESRLGWRCSLDFPKQQSFEEPLIRINTQPAAAQVPTWDESKAWSELADFYRRRLGKSS